MKLRCVVLCAVAVAWLHGAEPALNQVRNVYLLPMAGGLDQYLANRLTAWGKYEVVTDPETAEVLLTDQVGRAFEDRLEELYPPPPPPPKPEKEEEKKAEQDTRIGIAMAEVQAARRTSSFGRGRGNVFLVDRASRRVLWSTYVRPRNTQPDEMHHVAGQMVNRLEDAVKQEMKQMQRDAAALKAVPAAAPAAPAAPPQPAPAAPASPVKPAPAPAK